MKSEDLKKSILQYAMQGKLVAQDPNDEPASELLKRIKAEKEQLIKDGKIKKEKPLPPITQDEIPYNLPEGWQWVRLYDLCSILGDGIHGTPIYTPNTEYYFVNGNNLNDGVIEIKPSTKTVSKEEYEKYKKNLNENTVLISINGTLGNIAFYHGEKIMLGKSACYFNLLSGINKLYIKLLLNSDYFFKYAELVATGTTIKNVSLKSMKEFLIPLPPLAEQKRIIEKLEEILPLVDEYGKNEEILSEMNQKLSKQIRQSILQYAVQGKLVEQNPQDEPALELLKRIKVEREQLIKEGKIKKEKPLPPITQDEIPYDLPQGWEWVRLGEYADIGTGSTPSTTNTNYYQGNIPWITSSSTGKKFIDSADKLITQEAINDYNLRIYPINTLIIALYGQGKTRGQISELLIPLAINQACAAINSINQNYLLNSYIKLVFQKQYEEIRTLAAGCAQPNLNVGKIKNTLIPIPPLEEQKRIVAKVEELMKIVEKSECLK